MKNIHNVLFYKLLQRKSDVLGGFITAPLGTLLFNDFMQAIAVKSPKSTCMSQKHS